MEIEIFRHKHVYYCRFILSFLSRIFFLHLLMFNKLIYFLCVCIYVISTRFFDMHFNFVVLTLKLEKFKKEIERLIKIIIFLI